jgi:hypothetical protein
VQPPPPPPASCTSEASCRTGAPGTPGFAGTVSEVASGTNSNRIEVLGKKEEKKKTHKLTRAQKLKKALAACRHKYKHSKHKRVLCERQARHKYGPPSHHHKKKKK